ncbi:MAG: IS256 family transposase [Solirubrobacterales bacterium]|nr:IS256 family transposase [Solirubrobacterales bacterium]
MSDVTTLPSATEREGETTLDDLAREGARRMIATALEAEVGEYVERHVEELDEDGHRLVRRNGRGKERGLTVGSGTIRLKAPRVDDRRVDPETDERRRFASKILPRYARRSPKVSELLPALYLHGLSTGDFAPALEELLGEDAAGLSPSSISRLTKEWEADYEAFCSRRLDFARYAYLWVDGIHLKVRLGEDDDLCCLVVMGVREDGSKALLAVTDGYRESTESWAEAMRDLKRRGLTCPKLVTGDGALGIWAALRDVYPEARRQACWVHEIANVLDALPKRVQPRAKRALHEIMEAETRAEAKRAMAAFEAEFATKWPKAHAKLERDREALLAFYDFPAEHWRHIRTTNPIESTFSGVRLRTRVQKGAGSPRAALVMAFKLLDSLSERWRRVNGQELVADVLDGVTFKDGIKLEKANYDREDERVAA